jgi:glucose-6-phosphate isomerase
LGRILTQAKELRETVDCVVILGPPQMVMAAQALFAAYGHPYHNDLSRGQRGGRPRIYFAPAVPDNDAIQSLLEILPHGRLLQTVDERWGLIAIHDHDDQLVTGLFSLFWDVLQTTATASNEIQLTAVVGPKQSQLMRLAEQIGLPRIESDEAKCPGGQKILGDPPPEFFHPGVLLAGSVMGIDIVKLLHGAAAMWERFTGAPPGENPPLDFAGLCHLLVRHGVHGFQIVPAVAALVSLAQNLQRPRGDDDLVVQWIPAAVRHDRLQVAMSTGAEDFDRKKRKDRFLTELTAEEAATIRQARYAAGQYTAAVKMAAVDEGSIGQLIQFQLLADFLQSYLLTLDS